MDDTTYRIVRKYQDYDHPENNTVVAEGLTLDEAQEHCQDPDTSGPGWFDSYTRENNFGD